MARAAFGQGRAPRGDAHADRLLAVMGIHVVVEPGAGCRPKLSTSRPPWA
jgi:hypothetical protein